MLMVVFPLLSAILTDKRTGQLKPCNSYVCVCSRAHLTSYCKPIYMEYEFIYFKAEEQCVPSALVTLTRNIFE